MALSIELEKTYKTIIGFHREIFGESLSPMKLQKLCYYAQGYSLASGNLLFQEDFEAWVHGPVVNDLYHEFSSYGWHQISEEYSDEECLQANSKEYELVKDVVSAYGKFDGAALSTMTHREAPWVNARKGLDDLEGSRNVIPKDSIKIFFSNILKEFEDDEQGD